MSYAKVMLTDFQNRQLMRGKPLVVEYAIIF
ncbi:hypothetical protein A359_09370 [secondary endosymbiont of Ctenarytaina eucalypti]|uniref:Uncharacterized protein n=1 Tax=secondary endosymbiont of Ctenarytaina eucalypti TaxID=1199245 RepID=J3Z4S2_9ENTR|nr:hypothetical protein A359_09370 [secondary endosymbiont of Ctenarytaina eucalypti]